MFALPTKDAKSTAVSAPRRAVPAAGKKFDLLEEMKHDLASVDMLREKLAKLGADFAVLESLASAPMENAADQDRALEVYDTIRGSISVLHYA